MKFQCSVMEFHKDLLRDVFMLLLCVCELAFTLNIEELKPLHYEVNILSTPIKKDEEHSHSSIRMTSKYGQQYQCLLPEVEEEDTSEKEVASEKNTDILELLKPMKSGSCLLKSKDWWTYEFCFGHYIKQFHIEDGQILGQVITLGLYDSDYDWNNVTIEEKFHNVKQRYHTQYYVNGTKCDLTGQPRNAEVRIYCEEDAGDYIYRVDEPGTCSYLITIHSSRLCSHSLLQPVLSKKAHSIPCHPILSDDNFQKYMQKLNAQKELADKRRSEWLNNQKERLQFMKSENSQKNENHESLNIINKVNRHDEMNRIKKIGVGDESGTILFEDDPKPKGSSRDDEDIALTMKEYERELERLKTFLPSDKFKQVKNSLEKYRNTIFTEDEVKQISELSGNTKETLMQQLATTALNSLLKKLDQTEKDLSKASKGLQKVKSEILSSSVDDSDEKLIENSDKVNVENSKQGSEKSLVLKDDELQVLIKRLDRRSPGVNGKLYEMDGTQKKKLEHAVKEKLEKVGLDTGGRKIEVKIISAGYYDNDEGKDFRTLSDEETSQFQNMIMALLTGQQEAVQELERHKKLEESYKFTWENNEEQED